jgi:hypothetical protein
MGERRKWLLWAPILLLAACLLPVPPASGGLIRYRMPDGSMGFAGDMTSIPPGATVLEDSSGGGSMSIVTPLPRSGEVPPPEELRAAVRARCVAKWRDDYGRLEYCIQHRTRHALDYRELLLKHPPGSQGHTLVLDCRDEWSNGSAVDYSRAASCARRRHAGLRRTGRQAGPGAARGGGEAPLPEQRADRRLPTGRLQTQLALLGKS